MIEHLDGTSGMVVRRGSNYVSYENEGLVKKAWLYDIQMSEEKTLQNEPSVLETEKEMNINEYNEIGTDEYAKQCNINLLPCFGNIARQLKKMILINLQMKMKQ